MRREIVFSKEFDLCVETLGGYRAIDRAIDAVIDGLSRNPYAFDRFETDEFSFRYARTKKLGNLPELSIIFTIGADRRVTLESVEVVESY